MLDGIFRSNFRTKCKSLLNRIKTRLEVIKKRRNAMQRFLKKDIADLLKGNCDRNAYGRAEGLYMELILSSCYEFVEQCCECTVQHLKEMHKQSECPEQCRVAVASLIYAAARFADLPELLDLRKHFIDKYGKTIESYVKKEFMDALKSRPPTAQMKLQLMQEIAREFWFTWDSSHFEQQLQSLYPPTEEPAQYAAENGANGGGKHLNRNRSNSGPGKGKQVDNNEEENAIPKPRRYNSCTDIQKSVADKIQDENHLQEQTVPENNSHRKPFTNRIVPAPSVKSSINTNADKNPTNEDDSRPKSVRTKYLKASASTNHGLFSSSSSEYEVDPRENVSARSTRAKRSDLSSDNEEEEPEKFENLSTYLGEKTLETSSTARKEDNGTLKFHLPPPPGKRRYLFLDSSQGSSPVMEADKNFQKMFSEKSRFLTPEEQKAERVKGPISRVRSNSGHQMHQKMSDCDELAERVAVLNV